MKNQFNLLNEDNKTISYEHEEQKLQKMLNQQTLPKHIAIIMDGNGRWAINKGLPRFFGHHAGVKSLKEIINACCDLEIKVLTAFCFSTENWKRPQEEIDNIMQLLVEYLTNELINLCAKGVRINPIGVLQELPQPVREVLDRAVRHSRDNDRLILNLALNYGGRLELIKAIRGISSAVEKGTLKADQIDATTVEEYLFTAGQPEPDLLIRTSGDSRISNFMLWQIAYSEIWFTDILWPDFRRMHLLRALVDYQERDRRYGGVKDGKM
ncbi:Undecaprenyl pyrophosphate synthetase [Desulfotomaculum arcticum]|uniref:Isoprenyl transferase n=1 Tax=Desulfotruncus arcticus DSM 17038 TaxID=1121424 RepID=A0A1I2WB49_9FIRM|nr:isoprenyl transferase [Desulfotruncus arcticus]SFG97857.1 Undecaprenyl pyrophosphate synthetase [Desulfotomaculum arcticum] [Desulfotruncus arcticus DSM 17038]